MCYAGGVTCHMPHATCYYALHATCCDAYMLLRHYAIHDPCYMPYVTLHGRMPHASCHMPHVTCYMPHCHMPYVTFSPLTLPHAHTPRHMPLHATLHADASIRYCLMPHATRRHMMPLLPHFAIRHYRHIADADMLPRHIATCRAANATCHMLLRHAITLHMTSYM
jgi:hypothetical protein